MCITTREIKKEGAFLKERGGGAEYPAGEIISLRTEGKLSRAPLYRHSVEEKPRKWETENFSSKNPQPVFKVGQKHSWKRKTNHRGAGSTREISPFRSGLDPLF